MLTGNSDPDIVARAYELGCKHYFSKQDFLLDVDRQVGYFLKSLASGNANEIFAKEFITQDERLLESFELLRGRNLNSEQKILLLGPTGVGKTKIAKIIHRLAGGSAGRFVHVNVAELPDGLAESLLFGHKRGAFTGATEDKVGLLKQADGGTLFLDEIGTISLALQKKLLKALEEKEFTPLGADAPSRSDFRLITATCEDLSDLIETKRFRVDFYFRIKGIELFIPPLSERRGDIPILINHFLSQSARRIGFSKEAMNAMIKYDWFGNVRELEHVLDALIGGPRGMIRVQDLPLHVQRNQNPEGGRESAKVYTRNIAQFVERHGLRKFIEVIESEAFSEIYLKNGGNLTRTQQSLKISKSATYRILHSIRPAEGEYIHEAFAN
jgi:transcriptional regulator with PAS, ATPase and Fis domain